MFLSSLIFFIILFSKSAAKIIRLFINIATNNKETTDRKFRYNGAMVSSESTATSGRHMPRLADIAQATGYSVATVSKVLNNRPGVSAQTSGAILKQLERAGYRRHIGTESQRERSVEIVFQTFDTMWALEVLQGALDYTSSHDLNITVAESGNRQHPGSSWVAGLAERKPLGVVLIFSDLTKAEKSTLHMLNIPYVLFDPSGDPTRDSHSISADNWTGGVIATRHLLSLGHTKIGIITGPLEMMCSTARLDGFSAALRAHGISANPDWVREGDFTMHGGYKQAIQMLRDPQHRPTAIFASSDLEAMGVYEAARQLRLRIPDDLSVIGFDNIQTSAFMNPPLTTVQQPIREMGARAVQMIFAAMKNSHLHQRVIMPTTLIKRQSTRQIDQ